jgi:GTP cyclohydrolase IA
MTVHALQLDRRANEAIDLPLNAAEEAAMIAAAEEKIGELLEILRIDYRNDHNTRDTPARVAKMYVRELLRGRFSPPPQLTDFENAQGFDQLIVAGPIAVRSLCAHHLMPIYGSAFIGVLPEPKGRIIGLSKYDRVVEHFAARPQIQEELVTQIGNFLVAETRPRGLAVRVSAVHLCKTHRGIRAPRESRMVNTALFGEMRKAQSLKDEFPRECAILEGPAR